jgi:hypothetical protein
VPGPGILGAAARGRRQLGGALAFVPAPEAFRLLVIGIAASLLARRLGAPATALREAQIA